MNKRIYTSLAESKIIFDLQLAFRKNLSTVHALINLLKSIKQALDKGFMACGPTKSF